MKKIFRNMIVMFAWLLCIFLQVHAAPLESITIHTITSVGTKLTNMPIQLYKVGEKLSDGSTRFTTPYQSLGLQISNIQTDDIDTIETVIADDTAIATLQTENDG
ncbi:MAG: hypothetical protein MR283_09630 [Erysipelotrichaceae bacterium]|nr:hypothetical protein [Erysipelotrichaceae bacterium]